MKKQINPTIKAHLIRGAFYLLLLLAVCAIPFALAERYVQRSGSSRASANHKFSQGRVSTSQLPRGFYNARGTMPAPARTTHLGVPVLSKLPAGTCPSTITQSSSQAIVDGNSVACNDGVGTTENHYWRAFNMSTFTGGQEYDITSVSFGIELAQSGSGTGQPLTVNLYANNASPFPGGDWQSNLIGTSGTINIPDQADTIFEVPITATVPAGTLELVMEVTTPDGTAVGNLFFIGSNTDPETGPSYLSAADCGVNTPTPTGNIGFPNMHIVFNVNGSCAGAGTPSPTPTASPTPTPSPTPTCLPTYTTMTGAGNITSGGTDTGNHCDDCNTDIVLPFPVNVYGTPVSVATVGSNGDLQLTDTPSEKLFYTESCLPVDDPAAHGPFLNTLFPFYDDLLTTDGPFQTCSDCGIFTQTVGSAPNRQFIIRWKTVYFNNAGTAEFEVVLTEGSDTLSVIYGDTTGDNGVTAASGIQHDLTLFTSFSCFEATLTPGLRVDYIPTGCGSPTPTPTATATATATGSPTATATASATATPTASQTPRSTPTPRPRPTPAPRP